MRLKKILSITNLATTAIALNDKINEDTNKIPSITNLATTTANTENKIPNVSNLLQKLTMTQKLV